MIDTGRTSRAQKTITVVVAVAIALTLATGALGMAANDTTQGLIPGANSFGADETTSSDVTDADTTTVQEESAKVTSGPATSTPESVTLTPKPATSTPKATPTPEAATSTSASATSTQTVESAPETTLELNPRRDRVRPGRTTTYDIVVSSAHGGVGSAELAFVVQNSNVATITEVTVLGSGKQSVDIAEDGSRADINYTSRDTYDSGSFTILEVTVEGQSNGETSLSLEATNGNDELLLFNEQGIVYNVTGTDATVTVTSGMRSQSKPDEESSESDAFQIDLVEGPVISRLNPDEGDTYHKQGRFITAIHVTEDERRSGGGEESMGRTYQSNGCEVTYSQLSFNPDTGVSEVRVAISDIGGCEEISLSYAGYELPSGTDGWDGNHADQQELKDSATVTLHPGDEEVLTIDVMVGEEEQQAD